MTTRIAGCSFAATLVLGGLAVAAHATPVEIDLTSAQNGVTDIYSATFDPALTPCTGTSPSYCSFFLGNPPASRAIVITPNPTMVVQGVPDGIGPTGVPSSAPVPAPGSYLDLTLSNNNTSLTLAGGTVRTSVLNITISGSTLVTATNAGFVFDLAPQTVPVDANGRAEFLVTMVPPALVDFSHFPVVVTQCSGPLCSLILILNLDMIRYRLVIDYDASFGSFTGQYIGQTANNSMVFSTLNSGVPDIAVTDSAPPDNDLQIPFGDVTTLTSASRTVTVTNTGGGSLRIGDVAQANALLAPFAIATDGCSNQTLGLNATCAVNVTFSPDSVGFVSSGFDIPSNDADEPSVPVAVSGNGVVAQVPNIAVTDSVAPSGDGSVPFGSVTVGSQSDQTVTVTNSGTASLVLGQVAAIEQLVPPFSLQADTCSNQTLAPTATCTFGVRFAPTGPGPAAGTLDIPSNDPDTPSATLNVSGTGTGTGVANIVISDPTDPSDDRQVSFDSVRVNESFDRTITVSNGGTASLVLGTVGQTNGLAAPFSVIAGDDTCSGQTLAAAGSCTIGLRFEPTTVVDNASDSFDVPSNDPDEPSVTVSVSGAGVEDPGSDTLSPDGASSGFMAMDPATLVMLAGAGVWGWRRRRALAA